VRESGEYMILGAPGSEPLGGQTLTVVIGLAEAYPDGYRLRELENELRDENDRRFLSPHRYIGKLAGDSRRWTRVLGRPGKKGQGKYRFKWPS